VSWCRRTSCAISTKPRLLKVPGDSDLGENGPLTINGYADGNNVFIEARKIFGYTLKIVFLCMVFIQSRFLSTNGLILHSFCSLFLNHIGYILHANLFRFFRRALTPVEYFSVTRSR